MKAVILKTGKYSLNNGLGPAVKVEEGKTIQSGKKYSEDDINRMIDDDWAELTESDGEGEDTDVDEGSLEAKLKSIIDGMEDESDAKSALQDWGSVHTNVKVSKTKNVQNMIDEIILNHSNLKNDE